MKDRSATDIGAFSIFFVEKHYLLLLAPLLIFVVLIAIYPLFFSIYISFFKYRLDRPRSDKDFSGSGQLHQRLPGQTGHQGHIQYADFRGGNSHPRNRTGFGSGFITCRRKPHHARHPSLDSGADGLAAIGRWSGLEIIVQRRLWRYSLLFQTVGFRYGSGTVGRTLYGHACRDHH